MSTRYRTTYHGILLGLLLHVIMAQAVNAQRSLSERLDYFRSLGERNELELEEIRTPIVSYQTLMDSITQRILTEQCGYIVYPTELGNAFTFVTNPDANQAISRLGYLQSPSSLLPDHVEQCAYTPWLFGNELLTASKNKANADPLCRFFDEKLGPVKVTQALWYYFNKREPEKILPPPTVENMYFFKGKTGDLDNMQSLLNSDKQGYIICPVWTEDVTGVLDNPDENPSIRGSGTIEFFIKEAPLSIALNITPWEEDAIRYRESGFIPFVYDTTYTQAVKNWLLSVRELRPSTIRTFFCYFDKRSKEEIAAQKKKGNCSIPVFKVDGASSETERLSERLSQYNQRAFPIVPYWLQSVYEQLPANLIRKFSRMEYLGYVVDTESRQPSQVSDWQQQECLIDMPVYSDTPVDLLVLFRNSKATNDFLRSKESQMALLNNLFTKGTGTINRNPSLRKLNGLTLYFPDFDFKLENRRELVQFVKSTSFVIDSFCVDSNKIYKNYDLNVIFPIKEKKHIGYLSILLKYQLVDRLCFVDYDEMGVPVTTCENRENKQEPVLKMVMYEEECEVSLLDNLFNSLFYLLNPFPQGKQLTSCSDDLAQLANTEFSNPMLIYFVLGDIFLLLILLILITLYMTSSKFYMLAQHYKRYVLPLLLVFISEIVLVLYLITNIVSSRETFDIWTQMILLALPLFFFLLIIVPIGHREREPLP